VKHSHYFKDVSTLTTIDVYRLLRLFNVTDPCFQHALKKILLAGGRMHKDVDKDVQEAIDTLTRWQGMRIEDQAPPAVITELYDGDGIHRDSVEDMARAAGVDLADAYMADDPNRTVNVHYSVKLGDDGCAVFRSAGGEWALRKDGQLSIPAASCACGRATLEDQFVDTTNWQPVDQTQCYQYLRDNELVDIQLRDGAIVRDQPAGKVDWAAHTNPMDDVIKYRTHSKR
jgi:hypothetical protein